MIFLLGSGTVPDFKRFSYPDPGSIADRDQEWMDPQV